MALPPYGAVLILFGSFILVSIIITIRRRISMRNSSKSQLPLDSLEDLDGEQFAGESQAKLAGVMKF